MAAYNFKAVIHHFNGPHYCLFCCAPCPSFNISPSLSPGYGHTTPLSDTGKAFSIFYALIGGPFTMLVLTICVQKLMYPLVLAPVGLLHRSGMEHRPATIVHFLLLLILVILCFFVAPAAVFSRVEMSWSFLDGIYFCFISLCTIGLGDFVPGTQPGQKYRPLYQVAVMGECSCYYIPCRFMVVCECFCGQCLIRM